MSWGIGPWGAGSPWGTGSTLPPPTIIGVSPGVIERLGGTVVQVIGSGFADPALVEFLFAGSVEGTGYIFHPPIDIRPNKMFVGCPALDDGTYDLRITTDGGTATLPGAVEVKLHADEYKVVSVRSKFAQPWQTGPRILTGGSY